jgi:hypothetical protein
MNRIQRWFYSLSFIGILIWISLTSPELNQCVSTQYKNYSGNTLQENLSSLYVLLLGSRNCIGEFIHTNGEAVIALFTIILAIATILLWVVTQGILTDSRHTTEKQLRAYLFIEECFFETITQNGFTIALNIKNFGQTPAYRIRVAGQARPFPDPKTRIFTINEPSEYHVTLGPSAGYSHTIEVTKVHAAGISAIRAGVDQVYVWGLISYEDCFGGNQKTPFRLLQQGSIENENNRFLVCPEGNEAT